MPKEGLEGTAIFTNIWPTKKSGDLEARWKRRTNMPWMTFDPTFASDIVGQVQSWSGQTIHRIAERGRFCALGIVAVHSFALAPTPSAIILNPRANAAIVRAQSPCRPNSPDANF